MSNQEQVIERLIDWAEHEPRVRAMVLTSSRATPGAPVDLLSDYDVILALTEVRPFFESREWLEAFGRVLVLYRDPLSDEGGFETSCYVTQYESGLKIDFCLWPVGLLQQVAATPELPVELDAGYRVLLDKDRLTASLQPPTYRGYIPVPPTEGEYLTRVELLFHEATYVAKYLWRDDLIAAKHILDGTLKQENLIPILVWLAEIDCGWACKPGPYGRQLRSWMRPELWTELESTYAGASLEENWEAMFRAIALFRRAAVEVGERLGYAYPHDLDRRTVAHLQKVRRLGPGATSLESFQAKERTDV